MVREQAAAQSEHVAAVHIGRVRRDVADDAADECDNTRREVCAGASYLHVQRRAVGEPVIRVRLRVGVDIL
jgi:hypothetical protein